MELLTQFPAFNDEKNIYIWKIDITRDIPNPIIWLAEYLSQTILSILLVFYLVWN